VNCAYRLLVGFDKEIKPLKKEDDLNHEEIPHEDVVIKDGASCEETGDSFEDKDSPQVEEQQMKKRCESPLLL